MCTAGNFNIIVHSTWAFIIMCEIESSNLPAFDFYQLVGCVYLNKLVGSYCWLVQLLSIVCLKSGKYEPGNVLL